MTRKRDKYLIYYCLASGQVMPKQMVFSPSMQKTGRATPLLWMSVDMEGLQGHKNDYVIMLFKRLRHIVPSETEVIMLADREFGTLKNMERLKKKLNFDYIVAVAKLKY